MKKNFYQICFSNVDGWKTLNASEDTPEDVLKAFASLQNANIGVGDDTSKETGMQITCRGGNVFISKIIYGLKDSTNRSCHFAQGFCFSLDYICSNPVDLLKFSDDNFVISNSLSLNELVEATKTVPEEIIFDSVEKAHEIFSAQNISNETRINLLYAACKSLCGTNKLFIGYDESYEMFKSVATVLFGLLPKSLCRSISMSTFTKSQNDKIIFEKSPCSGTMCIDLVLSSNNALSEREITKYSKVNFLNFKKFSDAADYFAAFDSLLVKLGISNTASFDNFRIADLILKYENVDNLDISDEETVSFLYGLLEAPIAHSDYYDDLVSWVLGCVIQKDIELNEQINKRLIKFVQGSSSLALKDTACAYQSLVVLKMGVENAKAHLVSNYSYDSEDFIMLRSELIKSADGQEIVDYFYAYTIERYFDDHNVMINLGAAVRALPYNKHSMELLLSKTVESFYKTLNVYSKSEIDKTKSLIKAICGEKDAAKCFAAIVEKFWSEFDFSNLSKNNVEIADEVSMPKFAPFKKVKKALSVVSLAKEDECEKLTSEIHKINQDIGEFVFSPYEKNIILKICAEIFSESINIIENIQNITGVIILAVSNKGNQSPVRYILDNKFKSFYSEFEPESLKEKKIFSDEQFVPYVEELIAEMEKFSSEHKEEQKIVAERCKDYKKTLALVKKSKQPKSGKKQGLGDTLKGLFKKL